MPHRAQPHEVRGAFCSEARPQPCGVVIFGASGDLAHRMILPALLNLYLRRLLPDDFFVLGHARTPLTDDEFRHSVAQVLEQKCERVPRLLAEFLSRLHYHAGAYDQPEAFRSLSRRLKKLETHYGTEGRRVFHLAVPPTMIESISRGLSQARLMQRPAADQPWQRLIVEKPFGHDLRSAQTLNAVLHSLLDESQIYRIDHYLGKETVQNLLMFRFANAVFEPIWNRRYVEQVQITTAESIGIEGRAGYFEEAGLLRDMFQNHMLQMLSLVAMEPPVSFQPDRVRDEKVKLLRSIRPFTAASLDRVVVRGQYRRGTVAGEKVPGYREERGVAPDSTRETFVAAKLLVDNWRWEGVPFYLRTGKRLARRVSEIAVVFRKAPHSIFAPLEPTELGPNVLTLRVQPEEGIALSFQTKAPGPKLCMNEWTMDFRYHEVFGVALPEAYERLLLDAMLGDQTLFVREDDMEVAWTLLDPVLQAWDAGPSQGEPEPYRAGSWGPAAADRLLRRDGHSWINPEEGKP